MIRPLIVSLLLLSAINAVPCPSGYSQAPNGGYCYKLKSYYDWMIGQAWPKTYDQVEADCNYDGGGMLASIHNDEENVFIQSLVYADSYCGKTSDTLWTNIGLRCVGKDCKWDDGSDVSYTKFDKTGPSDDGRTKCYGNYKFDATWSEKSCTQQYKADCWACSVKSKPLQCLDEETAYNGGCVSVHTSPLDQKSAEASCPGGGHLISIHGFDENSYYAQLASKAGVTGTVYIGGDFSNGVFEWMDGSDYDTSNWANGFPNPILGTCVQMLLSSEFGVQGTWTNIDCAVQQPYICFRNIHGPILKIVFSANGTDTAVGTGWEAEFKGV